MPLLSDSYEVSGGIGSCSSKLRDCRQGHAMLLEQSVVASSRSLLIDRTRYSLEDGRNRHLYVEIINLEHVLMDLRERPYIDEQNP